MEQFYEKMGGTSILPFLFPATFPLLLSGKAEALTIAMSPDEAAPILGDFAGKLNMEMSGKFWAPSTSLSSLYRPASLHPISSTSLRPVLTHRPFFNRATRHLVLLLSIGH